MYLRKIQRAAYICDPDYMLLVVAWSLPACSVSTCDWQAVRALFRMEFATCYFVPHYFHSVLSTWLLIVSCKSSLLSEKSQRSCLLSFDYNQRSSFLHIEGVDVVPVVDLPRGRSGYRFD